MDILTTLLLPGLIGGLLVAVILFRTHRSQPSVDVFRDRRVDVINAARIRVAGIGGLGLVAMAATVALVMPRIRTTLAVGAVLGIMLAVTLIVGRRRSGGLPSSGRSIGAKTTLAIDGLMPTPSGDEDSNPPQRPLGLIPSAFGLFL